MGDDRRGELRGKERRAERDHRLWWSFQGLWIFSERNGALLESFEQKNDMTYKYLSGAGFRHDSNLS